MKLHTRFGGRRRRGPVMQLRGVAGCALAIFILGCISVFFFGIMYLMRSSEVVQGAIARVESSETAAMMLGDPVRAGWFIGGSISTSGSSGEAYLSIPVSGRRGRGTVHVSAYKDIEGWHYTTLSLELRSDSRLIDLLLE